MRLNGIQKAALGCCIILLASSVLQTKASLADYSETRSFRDALDGRSMEEAISGPVDRDTSSYGDRTSMSTSSNGSYGSSNANSLGGNAMAMSTMLTIPANGNLNPQQQQQQTINVDQQQQNRIDEQQKPTMLPSNSELERESGPIEPQSAGEPTSEQVRGPMLAARQRPTTMANRAQQPAAAGANANRQPNGASTGRLQQVAPRPNEQRQVADNGANDFATKEASFGEEPRASSQLYGSRSVLMSPSQPNMIDQQQQQQQQQQLSPNGEPELESRQADNSMSNANDNEQQTEMPLMMARQRYMNSMSATMLASGNGMSSKAHNQGPHSMEQLQNYRQAQNANNAANQQRQRQMAPPIMVPQMMAQTGYGPNANGNSNGMSARSMRRANQRRPVERKMSPAMVNAMLNKMLNARQQQQQQQQQMEQPETGSNNNNNYGANNQATNGNNAPYGQQMSVAALMRSPVGAEMLANMIIEQQQQEPGKQTMAPAKRDQYKRMMMAAIMQQASQMGQQQPIAAQTSGPNYNGNSNNEMRASMATGNGEYAPQTQQEQQMSQQPEQRQVSYGPKSTESPVMSSMMSVSGAMANAGPTTSGYAPKMGPMTRAAGMGMGVGVDMQTQTQTQQPERYQQSQMSNGADERARQTQLAEMQEELEQMRQQMMNSNGQRSAGANSASYQTGHGSGANPMAANRMQATQQAYRSPSQMARVNKMLAPSGPQRPNKPAQQAAGYEQQQRELTSNTKSAESQSTTTSPLETNDEQQQQQQPEAMIGGRQMDAQLPMNGFRQAYSPQQQRRPTMGAPLSGSNAYAPEMARPTGPMWAQAQQGAGVKGSPSPSSSSSSSSSDSQAKQQEQQAGHADTDADDANDANDADDDANGNGNGNGNANGNPGQQNEQRREHGAAPLGQAEPFAFDYKVEDNYGNGHYRKEEANKDGVVRGSYGYRDVSGIYRHVEYVADENGFRAKIKSNEPGLSSEPANPASQPSGNMASMINAVSGAMQLATPAGGDNMEPARASGANSANSGYNNMMNQDMMNIPTGAYANGNGNGNTNGNGNGYSNASPMMMMMMRQAPTILEQAGQQQQQQQLEQQTSLRSR